ncbi:MAG: glycosyltransferase [Pseudomonadota bacterium]
MARAPMAKRHKVLLFIPNLQQGGAERQILELMVRLPERFEPVLCLYHDVIHYRQYLPPSQPRHVLGVKRMGIKGLRRLISVLREEKPAILHSYRDMANFWARLAAIAAPVPVVLTSVRNRRIELLHAISEPFLSRISDRVLTNSEGVKRELIKRAHVNENRIQVLHNFVDLTQFRPPTDDERRAARARWGLADDEIALLLPGRVGRQKNHIGLTLALRHLRRRGLLPPNLRLVLAGRINERLVAAVLSRLWSFFDLAAQIRQLGTVSSADMPTLYHAADVLVLPSLYEGLPNAVIEGHASGLPAVVSRAANADGLVLDGESGYEVGTFDVGGLAAAIGRIVALAPEERRRMGAVGRDHLATRFHPDRVLGETVELYDHLLALKGLA